MDEHKILKKCGFDVVDSRESDMFKYNVSSNRVNVVLVINSMLYRKIMNVMKMVREDEQDKHGRIEGLGVEMCGIFIGSDKWDKKRAEEILGKVEDKLGLKKR